VRAEECVLGKRKGAKSEGVYALFRPPCFISTISTLRDPTQIYTTQFLHTLEYIFYVTTIFVSPPPGSVRCLICR